MVTWISLVKSELNKTIQWNKIAKEMIEQL